MTKFAHGGIISTIDQEEFEKAFIKKLFEDKPEGFVMHHPFKAEWIMKKKRKKIIKLHMYRFGMPYESAHKSIEDAAYSGCLEIEDNTACPDKITEGDRVIWQYSNPFDNSVEKLKKLAKYDEEE